MNFVARHNRAIKGCIIAGGSYLVFAVCHIYSGSFPVKNHGAIALVKYDNDNFAQDQMVIGNALAVECSNAFGSINDNMDINPLPIQLSKEKSFISVNNSAKDVPPCGIFKTINVHGKEAIYIAGKIEANFYTSARALNMPSKTIAAFIKILKSKVNFKSGFRRGDEFSVAYTPGNEKIMFVHVKTRRQEITDYKGIDNDDKYYFKN